MSRLTGAAAIVSLALLNGCSGMGTDYDEPATAGQIPFDVDPITPTLVSGLSVDLPAATRAPTGSAERASYAYRIGAADTLSIFVDQPLFLESGNNPGVAGSGTSEQDARLYTVNERGEIFLPLHGPLEVVGLTISEAYERIRAALAAFISDPQINVSVAEFRSQYATVISEAGQGEYIPITDQPLTIVDAVIRAGDNSESDLRQIVLKRDGVDMVVDVAALIASPDFGGDWILQHRDVVVIPENANGVYLLGEGPNQRRQIDPYRTSLAQVLLPQVMEEQQMMQGNQQGGFLNRGSTNAGSIFVIRGDTDFAQIYHLNARTPDAMILAERFPMQDGDIVFVTTRSVTRFNRYIAELLPSLAPIFLAETIID